MSCFKTIALLAALSLCPAVSDAFADTEGEDGSVRLPLQLYTHLLQQASDPTRPPRPAPAGYALGNAGVTVTVASIDQRAIGSVTVQLGIDVLEDEWVLIPILPAGTPVESAYVNGAVVQLLATADGLAWSTKTSGSYSMQLTYKVDAGRSDHGFTLPVPLPRAAAINLTATLPGSGLDATVIPAAGVSTTASGTNTFVQATVPTSSGVQISWRVPSKQGHTISRAGYVGELAGDAVVWTGTLTVEIFQDETVTLPLLPRSVTLNDVVVDGEEATILVEGDRFATLVKGEGIHSVAVTFQTPVTRQDGPPSVDLRIPRIPVSRLELTLPGKKELAISPASNVTNRSTEDHTIAVAHVPMTDRVSLTWSEAVPEDIRAELRSNAATYHTVFAEEGVLYVRARMVYEVTRGETNVIELLLPPGVNINRIESVSSAVADWRRSDPDENGNRTVSVFLDRQLQGPLTFDAYYDRSLRSDTATTGIDVPLLRSVDAQRQKGMVALLANSELTLNPIEAEDATKVGENQLPAFVRESVEMTIAHTYKYSETLPRLLVEAAEPERVRGKFDARVDTLVSLGDVTLTGAASIEVNVKSGSIMELELDLPAGVSLLGLTAPSLRTYKVDDVDSNGQRVHVEFTQEMEGQFRLDLTYERILTDGEPRVEVPTLAVLEAEVEQGRIAIEALAAVEIQPATTEQLSSLDINELPQQLVLRTTNPILLAYKYVHADPPPRLELEVTRHEVLGVQEAAIDQAGYKTLFTPDGLLVTTAEFMVRNSRKQFLRVRLPEDSEVWSVFVDGRPEKPALADTEEDARDVLIKIINSTRPFPVHVIYATSGAKIRGLGTLEAALPNPDILVTKSRWDIFLPEEMRYGTPTTNMDLVQERNHVTKETMVAELARLEDSGVTRQAIEPLRITVPTAGVHYAFEKLYANQKDQNAWFELPYASARGAALGHAVSLGGAALVWIGVGVFLLHADRSRKLAAVAMFFVGLVVVGTATGVYHVSLTPALVLSLVVLLAAAAWYGRRHLQMGREPQPAHES